MSDYAPIVIPIFISVVGLGISCIAGCVRWNHHNRGHQELAQRLLIVEQNQKAFMNQYAPPPSAPPAYYTSTYPEII